MTEAQPNAKASDQWPAALLDGEDKGDCRDGKEGSPRLAQCGDCCVGAGVAEKFQQQTGDGADCGHDPGPERPVGVPRVVALAHDAPFCPSLAMDRAAATPFPTEASSERHEQRVTFS
jgi:hypothetical protein